MDFERMRASRTSSLNRRGMERPSISIPSPTASTKTFDWGKRSSPQVDSGYETPISSASSTIDRKAVKAFAYSDPMHIDKDLQEVEEFVELIQRSNFAATQAFLMTKYGQTLYFTHGLAVHKLIRVLMSCNADEIAQCRAAIQDTLYISNILRKGTSGLFSGLFSGSIQIGG